MTYYSIILGNESDSSETDLHCDSDSQREDDGLIP